MLVLLREGKLNDADIEHIAEEIESMGKHEKRELISRLGVLLMHFLKWEYEPESQSRSWYLTLVEQRDKLTDHLEDNPSLKTVLDTAIVKAYRDARRDVAKETGLLLKTFPEECPYTFQQMMDSQFIPGCYDGRWSE